MKKIVSAVIAITLLAMLSACGNKSPEQSNTEGGNPSGVTESVPISSENANMNTENIPQELQPIPADYDSPAEQQGSLVELMYDTFESTTYEQKTQAIQKRAIVYLPYNYGIASWRTMESRLNNLNDLGIDTEFHKYPNLRHGFGLGTNTVAEGWLDDAVTFWEKQMNK